MMDDNNEELDNILNISAETTEAIITNISSPHSNDSSIIHAAYCDQSFKAFGDGYRSIHGYTSLVVCLLGAVANILNLVVLTRKKMINPTNAILTGLALADLLNMVEYIPFVIYMYFLPDSNGAQRKTYGWALFVLAHSNFSQVCHTIAIWLTVTLAVWRYIMVAMPIKSKTLCSMERAKWSIFSAYLMSPILCISNYLTFSIRAIQPKTSQNTSVSIEPNVIGSETTTTPLPVTNNVKYIVHLSDLAKNYPVIMTANFWLYSVVIKIIPCIMLTVVSYRLINSLIEAKKRKNKLLANKYGVGESNPPPVTGRGRIRGLFTGTTDDASGGADRTTKMLTAVLLLFLITEFPQGLLALLSGVLGDAFFKSCYIPLADLMDFLALLNSAINFILYCSMSKNFRDTFYEIFHIDRVTKLVRGNSIVSDNESSSNAVRTRSPPTNQFRLSGTNKRLLEARNV